MLINRSRIIVAGALLGAIIGLSIAYVATDAEKTQALLKQEGKNAIIKPKAKDWVSLTVAAVALVRQLADILEPKT